MDRVFGPITGPDTPGYAVGVVRDGRLVLARGYGMANLEAGVAVTPRSRFYIASASKQFTAACAALLVQEGRLSLAQDVRTYVPELPALWPPLTVGDLIHHTSGVREWSSLALFAGKDRRFEDYFDNRSVLRLLLRQRSLEFEPGTEYRYSSGGYVLLTEVIERVAGRPLPELARERIFRPLGMEHTAYDDDYARILPHRVQSYRPRRGGGYERWLKHFDLYGDGGVVTTVEDLARWDAIFYEDRLGAPGLASLLLTKGRLKSGVELPYAFGLQLFDHAGRPTVQHQGGMLGFQADMVRFPEERLSVIVLANTPERWVTGLAYQVADALLGPSARRQQDRKEEAAVHADQGTLRLYVGQYWNRKGKWARPECACGSSRRVRWRPRSRRSLRPDSPGIALRACTVRRRLLQRRARDHVPVRCRGRPVHLGDGRRRRDPRALPACRSLRRLECHRQGLDRLRRDRLRARRLRSGEQPQHRRPASQRRPLRAGSVPRTRRRSDLTNPAGRV